MINPEYLRRNLLVAKAIGANANAKAALERLRSQKRPPQWLVTYLEGIVERTEPLGPALACYRSSAPYEVPTEQHEGQSERCGQPVPVKKPSTTWAAHWRCVMPKDKSE